MPNMQSAYRRDRGDEDGQQSAACGRQRTDVSSLSAWPNCRLWHRRPRAVDKPAWATVRVAWRGVVVVPVVSVWQNIPCRVQRQHVVHHPRRLLSAASAKTEVMWLGSGQQINQVDVSDILILSSSVKVVESARDLGNTSLLTVSCRCRHTLLRFAGPDFTTWGSYVHSVGHYQLSEKDTSTGVHFMSPGLLQLAAVRSDRQTHAASTVGAERCGKADHRSQTSRTHHTDMASTSLVAGQTTSWIQHGQIGIPSAVKHSTWLSGRRYSSRLRKFCSLPQVLFREKVFCHSCSQSFWWQIFCCSWTTY